ncbi:MAG: nucleoside recognition domain-containing protein [Bacilli bacterium]|jgi:hypothetical protein|nr:nucleoside recognition domain-containing protein [Bacilli bacterium]HHU24327.1 nucleoside recognition protein [Acholeplasmataceae bacterium]
MEKVIKFITEFFPPTLESLFWMLLKIAIIIAVIMVALEILKALKVLDWLNKILYFFTKHLGITPKASTPLLIGILLGITYGAGAILASYTNKEMTKKDVVLVGVFLCLCHAIIEDTLLFVSFGAVGWLIVIIRFIVASVVTWLINLFYHPKENGIVG